jgi:hypothetical protein
MGIFVIFRVANPVKLKAALVTHFPSDHLDLGNNTFLVSAKGHAKGLSDTLEISEGDTGAAIVFRMSSYFGRATQDTWDWIAAKAEKSDG